MSRMTVVAAVMAFLPGLASAQKEQIKELQRDVAILQDQVRSLERSFNERVGSMTTLLQQAVDSINKLNTSVAVLDAAMRDREKNLAAPVSSVGTKVDQMASEFQYLRTTIEDMNGRMGKLERQLVDMQQTLKVIQAPPGPPPPVGAPAAPGAAGSPPAGMSAEALYANAMRDKDGGNYDMALSEFSDYLKYYGNTESAPNAQYYIGEILFQRKEFDEAAKALDAVLERYPENNKTLDAMYMKGRTLMQLNQRNAAAEEFYEVVDRAPRSSLAQKARDQLKSMGLSATRRTPASKRKK